MSLNTFSLLIRSAPTCCIATGVCTTRPVSTAAATAAVVFAAADDDDDDDDDDDGK